MNTGFTLSNISSRQLYAELFRRHVVKEISGIVHGKVFDHKWTIVHNHINAFRDAETYTVYYATTEYEADTLDEVIDRLESYIKEVQAA